jgi:hypothetical protein
MISVSSMLDLRTQSASSFGALRQFHLWIVLEQFQGRIEATTYEQASHHPHPESFVAPTGFALEGLKTCEKGLQENRKGTGPRRQSRTT